MFYIKNVSYLFEQIMFMYENDVLLQNVSYVNIKNMFYMLLDEKNMFI